MNLAQIVGISLVRNEDLFIERSLRNVLDFCDRLIVAENYSTDQTWEIVSRMAAGDPRIGCHRIRRTGDSHDLVQEFIGTPTWMFAVDGDEIYDPRGLVRFRQALLAGEYDRWWTIFGNVLNCVTLDQEQGVACGYLAPPCRSMTKLYNFNAISRWDGPCLERMLGGTPVFREGYSEDLRLALHEQVGWEESPYRCLHTCFLRRSSAEVADPNGRPNPVELASRGRLERMGLAFLHRWLHGKKAPMWKNEKYMRGDLVRKDVKVFFR